MSIEGRFELALLLIVFAAVVLISGSIAIVLGTSTAVFAAALTALLVFGALPLVLGILILRNVRRCEVRGAEQAAEAAVRQLVRRGDGTFTAHDLAAAGATLKEAQRILRAMLDYGFVEYAPSADGSVRYRLAGA